MKDFLHLCFYKLVATLEHSSIRTWAVASCDAAVSFQLSTLRWREIKSCRCQECIRRINTWRREQEKLWFIDGDFFPSLEALYLKGKQQSPCVVQILSIHMECCMWTQVYLDSFYSVPYMHTCLNLKSWIFSAGLNLHIPALLLQWAVMALLHAGTLEY